MPRFEVYDEAKHKPEPVVRFALRKYCEQIRWVEIKADGSEGHVIASLTPDGLLFRHASCGIDGIQTDRNGRIIDVS